jgi:hypothetical protein
MTDIFGGNHIDLKLADDDFPTTAAPGKLGRYAAWISTEHAEEALWKCADMTGQRIEISKVQNGIPHTANILWLRFVPMTADETAQELSRRNDAARRTMFAHMDGDFHANDNACAPRDYCKSLYAMRDSDVGIVCMEVINDLASYDAFSPDYAPYKPFTRRRTAYCRQLTQARNEVYPGMIACAHRYGMKLFAGHRMQLSSFAFPYEQPLFTIPFVDAHPELRCRARDGSPVDFLSYGYPEVQDFMIAQILASAQHGFDGVHLIFNRGQHLLFEEPVAARFRAKYGAADICRLPLDDPRLVDVRSEILLEFLQKLRQARTDYAQQHGTAPMQVYMTAYFTVADSLLDGFDLERFAAAGVIDGIVQTKMRVWEDTDGILDDHGQIDLPGYIEKARTTGVICRDHSSNMARMVEGVPAYRRIADRYGIALYTETPWEGARPAEAYIRSAKELYRAGARGLALWDCYPVRVQNLGEWAATARLGIADETDQMDETPDACHRIIRMLAFRGKNLRYYSASWRG